MDKSIYVDLENSGIEILDGDNFVKLKGVLKNESIKDWLKITLSNGQILEVTSDHPFMNDTGKTIASDLIIGNYLYNNDDEPIQIINIEELDEVKSSFDVETESGMFSFSGIRSSNCRTYNGYDTNFDFNVVLNSIIETGEPPKSYLYSGNQKDGRGNVCPVTIILPTLAMQCRKSFDNDIKNGYSFNDESILIDRFMHLLDKKINEAKDMLIERFSLIAAQTPDIAKFMYENNTMSGWDGKDIGSALKHGTLAIGQIGLAETLQILIGCDHTTEKGMNLAKNIESLFQQRCAEFKETYKLNFGNYFTPAENLCYTAMQKFKDKYGVIPNVSDKDYFTNSIHVPVWKDTNAFSKIDIESQLTGYSSAGCITYIELDAGIKNNLDALETIVNYAMDKDIPYFAVNVPNDTCLDCGYCDEFNDHCPECQSENIEQLRRVTGYLSTDYRNFNKGKQKEVLDRIKHSTT